MCGGGRTVVQAQPPPMATSSGSQKPKPVIYMRNTWLDGLGINAEQSGRNSLRIDPGSPTPMRPMRTGGPGQKTRIGGDSGLGIGTTGTPRPPIYDPLGMFGGGGRRKFGGLI